MCFFQCFVHVTLDKVNVVWTSMFFNISFLCSAKDAYFGVNYPFK